MDIVYDGYISRHINRKISEPAARILAKTRLTPNQMSWGAFGIALLSFISFALGQNIIGGLLVQLASIVDGIDGSLARLKGMSSTFGGFLDSVLDRYADILIILGMVLWSLSYESHSGIWIVGFLAIGGTLSVSYTRARIDSKYRPIFDKGIPSLASRDLRLFLIMLGGITGQAYFCLLTVAILTNLAVLLRLIYTYLRLETRRTKSIPTAVEMEEDMSPISKQVQS